MKNKQNLSAFINANAATIAYVFENYAGEKISSRCQLVQGIESTLQSILSTQGNQKKSLAVSEAVKSMDLKKLEGFIRSIRAKKSGSSRSVAKQIAARINGKKGGRPMLKK